VSSAPKASISLLDQIRLPQPSGIGRLRTRPDSVTADKAYSSLANRQALRGERILASIPETNDQVANRNAAAIVAGDRTAVSSGHADRVAGLGLG
jgi:hypothetical protein